jgi:hypothetical protein
MIKSYFRYSIFVTTDLNLRRHNKILGIFSANNNEFSIVMNKY